MKDYEAFNEALQRDTTYAATLSRSLSLVRTPLAASRYGKHDSSFWAMQHWDWLSLHPEIGPSCAKLFTQFDLVAVVQVLEEFYENLKNVGVSAATGEGIEAFFEQVQTCAEEYRQLYLPELQRRQQVRAILHLCQASSYNPCPGDT